MNEKNAYLKTAQSYIDGYWELFGVSGAATKERGLVQGPSSYDELAQRAEKLSVVSDSLTNAIASQLSDTDIVISMEGSARMLAKMLTDLEVSEQLLQAANDENNKTHFHTFQGTERSTWSLGAVEDYFNVLLKNTITIRKGVERGDSLPSSIVEARAQLSACILDSLTLISDRATKTAMSSFGAIVGLGSGELARAAGALGMDIARIVGQAERISHLYELFRCFVGKVYDSLVVQVGKTLVQKVG